MQSLISMEATAYCRDVECIIDEPLLASHLSLCRHRVVTSGTTAPKERVVRCALLYCKSKKR